MNRQQRSFFRPVFIFLILMVIMEIVTGLNIGRQRGERIEYAKLLDYVKQDALDAVILQDDMAYAHLS